MVAAERVGRDAPPRFPGSIPQQRQDRTCVHRGNGRLSQRKQRQARESAGWRRAPAQEERAKKREAVTSADRRGLSLHERSTAGCQHGHLAATMVALAHGDTGSDCAVVEGAWGAAGQDLCRELPGAGIAGNLCDAPPVGGHAYGRVRSRQRERRDQQPEEGGQLAQGGSCLSLYGSWEAAGQVQIS